PLTPRDRCSFLQHTPPSSLPSTRADDSHYATAAPQSAPERPIFLGPTALAEAATAVRSCSTYCWLARSAASQPQWVGGGHRAWRLGRLGLADLSMVGRAPSGEEEAMSTAEPLSKDQWPATGVDLETRRRRILAT